MQNLGKIVLDVVYDGLKAKTSIANGTAPHASTV
jgi:hypothetical protein